MYRCKNLFEEYQRCQESKKPCEEAKVAYERCIKKEQDEEKAAKERNRAGQIGLSPSGKVGIQVGGGMMIDGKGRVSISLF